MERQTKYPLDREKRAMMAVKAPSWVKKTGR